MENVQESESEEQLINNLTAWQGGREGPSWIHNDPYADSSIHFGAQPAYLTDQTEARKLVMKRKVLRHRPDGRVEVLYESPSARPWSPGCQGSTAVDDNFFEREIASSSGTLEDYLLYNDDWFPEDGPGSLLGDFGSATISEYSIPGRAPRNYIALQPVRVKRTDPVAKLNGYKLDWERFGIPGEDAHLSLRWAMRKQMLKSGLPPREQKRLVPNMYEVPTMKKRDTLRFGVRWDLAHFLMPRRNSFS